MRTHHVAVLLNLDADDELTTAEVAGILMAELPNWNITDQITINGASVDLGGTGAHLERPPTITDRYRDRTRSDT